MVSTKIVFHTGDIRPAKLPGAARFVILVSVAMSASGGVNRIERSPGRRIGAACTSQRVTVGIGKDFVDLHISLEGNAAEIVQAGTIILILVAIAIAMPLRAEFRRGELYRAGMERGISGALPGARPIETVGRSFEIQVLADTGPNRKQSKLREKCAAEARVIVKVGADYASQTNPIAAVLRLN